MVVFGSVVTHSYFDKRTTTPFLLTTGLSMADDIVAPHANMTMF